MNDINSGDTKHKSWAIICIITRKEKQVIDIDINPWIDPWEYHIRYDAKYWS